MLELQTVACATLLTTDYPLSDKHPRTIHRLMGPLVVAAVYGMLVWQTAV